MQCREGSTEAKNKRGAHAAGEAFLFEGWLHDMDFGTPNTVQTFDPGVLPGVPEAGTSGNLASRAGQARLSQEDVLQRERARAGVGRGGS